MAEEKGPDDGKGAAMIKLISSDNQSFEVSESVASLSTTISNMIEDGCAEGGIPLPNVTGSVLAKVLEYCNNKHAAAKASEPGDNAAAAESSEAGGSSSSSSATTTPGKVTLNRFDEELMEDVDQSMLFEIAAAANYLNVKDLLDLTCQAIANRIAGKTPEEIREIFGIVNDFTPEEEEEIRARNAWAFD